MNLPESGSEARKRFEMQLGEFGIPLKFVDDIIGHHTLVSYNKGSMIFLQGSPADVLFWVFTGLVKIYCPRSDGTRIMVKLGGPGDLITRDHLIKLLQSVDHAGLLQVIERLNTLWSLMAQWFGAFLGMSFRERLEVVLHDLGAKFGVRDKRGILLMPELAHADLADMIGSSRPMVSRLIAEMTEEGRRLHQGKQFVLLEPFAGGESDSANQLKDRRSSYPESSRPLGRPPLFKPSVGKKNGRLPVSPVVPPLSKCGPKGPRV